MRNFLLFDPVSKNIGSGIDGTLQAYNCDTDFASHGGIMCLAQILMKAMHKL